jgi:hypothetical protein
LGGVGGGQVGVEEAEPLLYRTEFLLRHVLPIPQPTENRGGTSYERMKTDERGLMIEQIHDYT